MKRGANPKLDAFFSRADQWRIELHKLRAILLGCGLSEELKWSKPCYSFQGHNIAILQPFKAHCAVLFFKGALLKGPDGILVKTGEHAEVGRQARFTSVRELVEKTAALKACIRQAIEVDKAGLKVPVKKVSDLKVPEELRSALNKTPGLKAAFGALTPGRQKAYIFFIAGAKQSKTREARIQKCAPRGSSGARD